MVTITRNADVDFTPPPADTYTLEFTDFSDIMEVQDFNDPSKTKNRIKLTFTIVDFPYDAEEDDEDLNGTEIRDFFTVSLHEKSKLYPFIKALRGGEDIPKGESVELDDLLGNRIKATVQIKDNGYPTLTAPLPARKRKATTGKPAKANPFKQDDDAWPSDE